MTKLLTDEQAEMSLRLEELRSLEDAKLPSADLAHRALDQAHVETITSGCSPLLPSPAFKHHIYTVR